VRILSRPCEPSLTLPDVFYTNSRYAKVGGLPPHELNQLELQFLLLNDFRLVIPPDEMQRYGDRLLGYWEGVQADDAREVKRENSLDKGTSRSDSKDPREMEVDQVETQPAKSPSTISAPPPSLPVPVSQPIIPRGREREARSSSNVSFAPPPASAAIRDWVRGDEVMGSVMGGRMTSPMRE
jgi:hypothetical protein